MKKTLLGLTVLALASTAAADQVGIYFTGLQYQTDNNDRFSVGLNGSLYGAYDKLIPLAGDFSVVAPYYGYGVGAGFGSGNINVRPNVLAGLNLNIIPRFTPYAEISAGPSIYFGSTSGVDISIGTRIGVNYRF